jgi:hypothetical protein
MIITVEIGSESHTSNWAKGFVFLVKDGKEDHIYKSPSARLIRRDAPNLIGNKGRHGSWTRYQFDVAEGSILKLFTQGNGQSGSGYFRVSANAPLIKAYGATTHGNGAEIEGQIEWISPNDFNVDPRLIASFDKDNLTIKELLPA